MKSDKRPMLADLRESGSLEQDADVVMFIYRDDVYHSKLSNMDGAEIIVAKHRHDVGILPSGEKPEGPPLGWANLAKWLARKSLPPGWASPLAGLSRSNWWLKDHEQITQWWSLG